MKKITLIVLMVFILTSCSNNIARGLSDCEEEQKTINMGIIPICSVEVFKNNGWHKVDAIEYMKNKKNIDINKFLEEGNSAWISAWGDDF